MNKNNAYQQSPEYRSAMSAFMTEFWNDQESRAQFGELMSHLWQRYKQRPQYEHLRRRLVDAARRNGYHS